MLPNSLARFTMENNKGRQLLVSSIALDYHTTRTAKTDGTDTTETSKSVYCSKKLVQSVIQGGPLRCWGCSHGCA
jgi:hypothetical protein